jgi:hypothetical protein
MSWRYKIAAELVTFRAEGSFTDKRDCHLEPKACFSQKATRVLICRNMSMYQPDYLRPKIHESTKLAVDTSVGAKYFLRIPLLRGRSSDQVVITGSTIFVPRNVGRFQINIQEVDLRVTR